MVVLSAITSSYQNNNKQEEQQQLQEAPEKNISSSSSSSSTTTALFTSQNPRHSIVSVLGDFAHEPMHSSGPVFLALDMGSDAGESHVQGVDSG